MTELLEPLPPDFLEPYHLPSKADYMSPAGVAEIRELHRLDDGEMTHALVSPGKVSDVGWLEGRSEIFYVHAGNGQLWIDDGTADRTIDLRPGRTVLIPPGARFQYRAGSRETLTLLLTVLPRWRRALHHRGAGGPWPPSAPNTDDVSAPPGPADGPVVVQDLTYVSDYPAPDRSDIRLLPSAPGGGLAHCVIYPGHRTRTVRHRTVTEIWFALGGSGELARWDDGPTRPPRTILLWYGVCVGIPVGVPFQFRATGTDPLRLLLLTMPRWPGHAEADTSVEQLDAWPEE